LSKPIREDDASVRRHFDNRCRAASDPNGWNVTKLYKNVEAKFVTSGNLGDAAMAYACATPRSHGIECSVMTRNDLIAWLEKLGQDRLIRIIETYY
jgi:hypothetical protein